MIEYTKQAALGRFGERWACYATALVNIIETELGRGLDDRGIGLAVGTMFLSETVLLSNYKDHANIKVEAAGWSEKADPEFHFFVKSQSDALRALMDAFRIPGLKQTYVILKLYTAAGSHFILKVNGAYTVNPDPDVTGPVVQKRVVKV